MIPKRVSPRRRALLSSVLLAAIIALSAPALDFNLISLASAQQQRECPVRVTLLQVNDVY